MLAHAKQGLRRTQDAVSSEAPVQAIPCLQALTRPALPLDWTREGQALEGRPARCSDEEVALPQLRCIGRLGCAQRGTRDRRPNPAPLPPHRSHLFEKLLLIRLRPCSSSLRKRGQQCQPRATSPVQRHDAMLSASGLNLSSPVVHLQAHATRGCQPGPRRQQAHFLGYELAR